MNGKIIVNGAEITVTTIDDKDYVSLTDMLKAKDGDFFISRLAGRNRNTVEFLGIWEQMHNPDFNYGEFATIRSQAGSQQLQDQRKRIGGKNQRNRSQSQSWTIWRDIRI